MIYFFGEQNSLVYAVLSRQILQNKTIEKLHWLFSGKSVIQEKTILGNFIGPRASMVSPWSTNAVEITQNMGIVGIQRIEAFRRCHTNDVFDPMLFQQYEEINQQIFDQNQDPKSVLEIDDIAEYSRLEGLALSEEEVIYLDALRKKIGRKLTDVEVFGFSQVNSEHCRHKIFNGTFEIDGQTMPQSLFKLIKETAKQHPNHIISAYKDNVAFVEGPTFTQFSPVHADKPSYYQEKEEDSVISLKAETHNFPTTVEPFNGAATGSGGEIRDRLAGGKGSIPLAGTAVYMTSYPRMGNQRPWLSAMKERKWLYQSPMDLLIKASDGASDFGNKFGQPLINGSLLTFEHDENQAADSKGIGSENHPKLGFDKVIMLAGGIGYGLKNQAKKDTPETSDKIVVLGGENYRIGIGGASVSSENTGELSAGIELNAVQRSNPEMQKRVANVLRALVESKQNPIISVHDHGAGGHLNCISELVEDTGGIVNLDQFPVGDPSLSAKEIVGNESQERMGLIIKQQDAETLKRVAERERAPYYEVGEVTNDQRFSITSAAAGKAPFNLSLQDLFGNSPKTIIQDQTVVKKYQSVFYDTNELHTYLQNVLRLESVACKDWLTNKVDRSVGGKVATQQCVGPLQLPLNNCGVTAIDFKSNRGIATALGHSPISGLIDPEAGSINSIAEALTNLVWAPLKNGLNSVSLSANWMWPCKNKGEDARLYSAVKACSEFAIALGINIPTGKDSLSMKQKYPNDEVISPGTVIISAVGECSDIRKTVMPLASTSKGNKLYYLNLSSDAHKLGGSSFAQTLSVIGDEAPTVKDSKKFKNAFDLLQDLIKEEKIVAGHDISAGGMITTLLEMCFPQNGVGMEVDLTKINEPDLIKLLFSENTGLIIQSTDTEISIRLKNANLDFYEIGTAVVGEELIVKHSSGIEKFNIPTLRDVWMETSYLLDKQQCANNKATERFENYKNQPLQFKFPNNFDGMHPIISTKNRPKAAIIREKGSNSEREMANAMYLAGFDVKDVHMTDLISGRETLEDIQFIGAVGGFSNSDVLGSAKGWAGSFLYNEKANQALTNFFAREDTLSVGICNGCQLFMELEVINPEHATHGKMRHNDSKKHESAFTSVTIQENNSVMLSNLAGSTLGVWISHGEGKFHLPMEEKNYDIVAKYGYSEYPANPNGSDYNTAMLCSKDGRHLVTMPHIERSTFQWNWPHYPAGRKDEVSPWLQAFVNAREWVEKAKK